MFIEIIGIIAILMALRAVITKDRAEKLLYINVIGFCVSALIGANAIAYSLKDLEDEITYDKNMEEHKEN
nr:DUF2109 family protein [uncultured Methanobrevibacter sp.]